MRSNGWCRRPETQLGAIISLPAINATKNDMAATYWAPDAGDALFGDVLGTAAFALDCEYPPLFGDDIWTLAHAADPVKGHDWNGLPLGDHPAPDNGHTGAASDALSGSTEGYYWDGEEEDCFQGGYQTGEREGEEYYLQLSASAAADYHFPSPPLSAVSPSSPAAWQELDLALQSDILEPAATVDVGELLGRKRSLAELEEPTEAEPEIKVEEEVRREVAGRDLRPRTLASAPIVEDKEEVDLEPPLKRTRKAAAKVRQARLARPASPSPSEDSDESPISAHGTLSRPFSCTMPGCSLSFRRKFNRDAHELTHTEAKPLVCGQACPTTGEVCIESFRRGYDLRRHQGTVHAHKQGEVRKRCLCGAARRRAAKEA